MMAEVI